MDANQKEYFRAGINFICSVGWIARIGIAFDLIFRPHRIITLIDAALYRSGDE